MGGLVRANLEKGGWLAIVGAGGGLGHLGVQFAKALGLKVLAVDARDEALELAKECGADVLVDVRQGKEKAVEQVMEATEGKGADATINVSDHDSAAATAVAITKMHGLMIQIAQPENVTVLFRDFILRDVRIHGSLTSSYRQGQKMLDFASRYHVKVHPNQFTGLKELPKMVELAYSGKMKGKAVWLMRRLLRRRSW